MSAADKKIWKDALKKPGISAYELYMKECLCTMIRTGTYPDGPTESGGFSCGLIAPGLVDAPEGFVGQVPPGDAPDFYPPGAPCPSCEFQTPSKYNAKVQGLTGEAEPYNGEYVLDQGAACEWQVTLPQLFVGLDRRSADDSDMVINIVGDGVFAFYTPAVTRDDCYVLNSYLWDWGIGYMADQAGSGISIDTFLPD